MEMMLSKEVQAGLDAARLAAKRKRSRLRLRLAERTVPVLELGKAGFVVARDDAPNLRGLVDLYDGANHLFQCLIVASEEPADEMRYDFKRATPVADRAPLDFVRSESAPVALIPRPRPD